MLTFIAGMFAGVAAFLAIYFAWVAIVMGASKH